MNRGNVPHFNRSLAVLERRKAEHTGAALVARHNRRLDKIMGRLAAVGTNAPGGAA